MKFQKGQTVTHLKTGNKYIIICCPAVLKIEKTQECAYAYMSTVVNQPTIWVRPEGEMEDGRFE